MAYAAFPVAKTSSVALFTVTSEGSSTITPFPFAYILMWDVPRSIAKSVPTKSSHPSLSSFYYNTSLSSFQSIAASNFLNNQGASCTPSSSADAAAAQTTAFAPCRYRTEAHSSSVAPVVTISSTSRIRFSFTGTFPVKQ